MFKLKSLIKSNSFSKMCLTNKFLLYKKFSNIISVDMGATNTCISILESSGPRVIENAEGKIKTNKKK